MTGAVSDPYAAALCTLVTVWSFTNAKFAMSAEDASEAVTALVVLTIVSFLVTFVMDVLYLKRNG